MDVYFLSLRFLLIAGVVIWLAGTLRYVMHRAQASATPARLEEETPDSSAFTKPPLAYAVLSIVIGLSAYYLAPVLVSLLPLSPGTTRQAMGWGIGVASGGCGALAMCWILPWRWVSPLISAASLAPGLVVITAIVMVSQEARLDALLGTSAGWLLVTLGASQSINDVTDEHKGYTSALLSGAGFTIVLCLAFALALIRDNNLPATDAGGVSGGWVVAVIGAAVGAIPILALAQSSKANRLLLHLALALLWLLCAGAGVLQGLGNGPGATRTIIVLALGAAGALLLTSLSGQKQQQDNTSLSNEMPVAMLLIAAGAMSAHLLLQAFGVVMMVLAAWPFAFLSSQQHAQSARLYSQKVWPLLMATTAIVAYRLFEARYINSLQSINWSDTYVLTGLLLAAVVPTTLVHLVIRGGAERGVSFAQVVLMLSGVALVHILAISLFGLRIAPALAMGCILACAFAPERRRPLISLLALSTLLLLAQWLSPMLVLADTARSTRIVILLTTTAIFLAALGLHTLVRWIEARRTLKPER